MREISLNQFLESRNIKTNNEFEEIVKKEKLTLLFSADGFVYAVLVKL